MFTRLEKIFADGSCRGDLIDRVQDSLHVVLEIVLKLEGQKGFQVLPKRWDFGWRVAFFSTRTHARLLRPGLAHIAPQAPPLDHGLQLRFDQLDTTINDCIAQAYLT